MSKSTFDKDFLNRARELGSATLHEAAGRIGALPRAVGPVDSAMSVSGPAFTIRTAPGDNLWVHRGLYAANAGDVLVVSTFGGYEWGYWGEILSEAAMAQGLAGLVIDGGTRDTDSLCAIGFPIFSRGPCIRGTHKDPTSPLGSFGQPISVGDVVVTKGDLVVGDRDGVVVIPTAAAAEAVAAGVKRVEKEATAVERLRAGETTLSIFELE